MNEQLIVKNFGPIKDATVDFKKVTVFIGPTGGGKSTLAKLAAVFRDAKFHYTLDKEFNIFNTFKIKSYLLNTSYISWTKDNKEVLIKNKEVYFNKELSENAKILFNQETDLDESFTKSMLNILKNKNINASELVNTKEYKEEFKIFLDKVAHRTYSQLIAPTTPVYAPSERAFIADLEYSWAGLMRDDIGLSKMLLDFANSFSQSRKNITELEIPLFDVKYLHIDGRDFIKIPDKEDLLMLLETASGVQSTIPMLVLLEHLSRQKERAQSFIIEEPELNLYPTAQQGLMNWLVEKCTVGENDLTITTHSPYILSHLNLLLYAYQVAEKHPDRADDVAKIVPRESWINPEEFACYHVEGQKDNGVYSIVNPETGLISYNMLDALAGNSATEFDKLLDINAGLEVE